MKSLKEWRDKRHQELKETRSVVAASMWLCKSLEALCEQWVRWQQHLTTALGNQPAASLGMLPLPVEEFEALGVQKGKELGVEASHGRGDWYWLVATALNYLGTGGMDGNTPRAAGSSSGSTGCKASRAQRAAMERLSIYLEGFLADDKDEDLAALVQEARNSRVSYSGDVVTPRRDLVAAKVIPTWPEASSVGILGVTDLLDGPLKEATEDPLKCFKPKELWPKQVHKSKVYATQAEWDALAHEGLQRGIFQVVPEDEVFRTEDGTLVVHGAMGVDKPKLVDDVEVVFLRFFTILTPLNQFL